MRLLVLLLTVAGPLFAQSSCTNVNFEPPTMSEGSLTNQLKGSVLRLQVQGATDSGTGYLIDSTAGYILTALHVVSSASGNSTINVTSPDPFFSGISLTAKIIKTAGSVQADASVSPPDLALLKLDNPELTKRLHSVDISLRFPSVDAVLYAMGYPTFGDQTNSTFAEQPVKFMSAPPDGSIQVTQAIFGGNSGGPLLDGSGDVLGTCRQSIGVGAAVALYTPMSDAETLLDQIPLSDRMKSIDQQIRSHSISQAALASLLQKSSDNPTNVELYSWVKNVLKNDSQYKDEATRKLLECPMRALMQRGMDDLVLALTSFASVNSLSSLAEANMNVGARELTQGRAIAAQVHLNSARAEYLAANDNLGSVKATLLSTRANIALGSFATASQQSNQVLANFNALDASDKAVALGNAGTIEAMTGQNGMAIPKLEQASVFAAIAGQNSAAAAYLNHSAELSLTARNPDIAKRDFTLAVDLYRADKNKAAEAESTYHLVQVNAILGDATAVAVDMRQYLDLDPNGPHADEVQEILWSAQVKPGSQASTPPPGQPQ